MKLSYLKVLIVGMACSFFGNANAGEAEFEALVSRMESDAIALAREVEDLYINRCDEISLQQCDNGNYDECQSLYPNQVCPGGADLNIAECGDGVSCSGLWDYTVSNIRIHSNLADSPGGNPSDYRAIETVCFTQQLDDFFVSKRQEQKPYWDALGLRTPQMYFGSHNGVFRIFPARHSKTCGSYDPRVRPWYIAASSGPKNIVLILDTSGSMSENNRISLMKDAATQIVNTLTVGDRVAIVDFSTDARLIAREGRYLFTASKKNKASLIQQIDQLEAGGKTNFVDAFTKAFDVVNDSIDQEFHVGCNTAFLFLTDGLMTEPENINETTVIDLVSDSIGALQERLHSTVFLFTYSVSPNEQIHTLPKRLACATGDYGVWSKIVDYRDIFDSLTSYYQLFALGLGRDANENFRAWVEPYRFASGNILGTTVSAPVFDRSKDPHLFLGVVGLDFPLSAVDRALETPDGSMETLDRIVSRSTAVCPLVELKLCELESYRRRGQAGNNALCTSNCSASDFVDIEEVACPAIDDYPRDLLINRDVAGQSYEERVCCKVGETAADHNGECPASDSEGSPPGLGAIAGIVVAVAALILVICGIKQYNRNKAATEKASPAPVPSFTGCTPVPPPTAPHEEPKV